MCSFRISAEGIADIHRNGMNATTSAKISSSGRTRYSYAFTNLRWALTPSARSNSTTQTDRFTIPQDASPMLSPLAQFMSKLQDLQQNDPDQFKQVTA